MFGKLLQNLFTPHLSFMEKPRYNSADHVLLWSWYQPCRKQKKKIYENYNWKKGQQSSIIDVDPGPMNGDPWNSQRKKEVSSIQVNLGQNIRLGIICSLTKQIIVYIISEMIPCYLCKFEISKLTEVLLLNKDQSAKQWQCQLCGIAYQLPCGRFYPKTTFKTLA